MSEPVGSGPESSEPEHVRSTRAAYDATVDGYLAFIGTELSTTIEDAVDLALVDAFTDHVRRSTSALGSTLGTGLVADLGCGPGRVAGHLDALGLDVVGFDLSPAMVEAARAAHPAVRFEVASLTAVPLADGSLAGAVCWYSIIHTPPDRLDDIWSELARLIAPGGWLLIGFQAGSGDAVHRSEVAGRAVSLTNHRHDPEHVIATLASHGFSLHSRTRREPVHPHESTPQAFVIARREAPPLPGPARG